MTHQNTFTDAFRARIAKIEADAKACGLNWTSLCIQAGISRATPDRWKKKTPKTVEVVTKIENIIAAHKASAK